VRKAAAAFLNTSLACLVATTPAYAQPSGLRLQGNAEGFTLRGSDNGLRLRFTSTNPLHDTTALAASDPARNSLTRNTVRADWPIFGYGLRTSLGLSWSTPEAGNRSFSREQMAPTTFLGFGWRSESFQSSGWKFSAELGTNLSGRNTCTGITSVCLTPQPQGLNGEASGNGLRLNPYVSFGATLNY